MKISILINTIFKDFLVLFLLFLFTTLSAQETRSKSLLKIDTCFFNYQADTAFHNRVQQVHTKLLFGIPTSTHIRWESHGLPGRFKFYFVQNDTGKFENIILTRGPRKYRLFEPFTIFNIAHNKSKLLAFEQLFVLVDSNNQYVRKWQMDRSFRYSFSFHVNQVNEYYIDSTLFILFIDLRNKFKGSNTDNSISFLPSIAQISIDALLKKRKLNAKYFTIQKVKFSEPMGIDYWRSAIYADTTRRSIWITSANLRYIANYNVLNTRTECYIMPDPIPPGVEYLKYQSIVNDGRWIDNVIKFTPQDSIIQLFVHPLHIYALPQVNKLLYSYFVAFNEETGDSIVLTDLHRNSLIRGNHWSEVKPSSAIFQIFGSLPLIVGFVILEHERTRFICCRNWLIEPLVYIKSRI